MGKILKAMTGSLKAGSAGRDALDYIATGDPAAAAAASTRPPRLGGSTGRTRSRARWPTPARWARRIAAPLRGFAANGSFDQIGSWLSKALGRAKGDEDLHDLVREELATVHVPTATVSAMTVIFVEHLIQGRRPTSAGRHLLALSDTDLMAAVTTAQGLRTSFSYPYYPRLAGFLLETAPERLEPLLDLILHPKPFVPGVYEVILQGGRSVRAGRRRRLAEDGTAGRTLQDR